tara:strand:- start:5243 stop:5509 length:267 start_codon:yes stop_codon:yes gene_type:complete
MTDQARQTFNRETARLDRDARFPGRRVGMRFLRRILSGLPWAASGDRIPLAGPATLSGGLEFAALQWAACEGAYAPREGVISQHDVQG